MIPVVSFRLLPLTQRLAWVTTSTTKFERAHLGAFLPTAVTGLKTTMFSTKGANATTDPMDPPPLPSDPTSRVVKAALCQVSVSDDKAANIRRAGSLIAEAASRGAKLVVLPEIWNSPYSNDAFPKYAEDIDPTLVESTTSTSGAPSFEFMSRAAKDHGVVLVGGSIPTRKDDRLYNTCFVFDKMGELIGSYSKLHLFDIEIPNKITFRESDTLTGGEGLSVIDTDVGRIGLGICYDIRFPELAALYSARGVQIMVYPGAFNMTTGPLHWELLQRARAVDNQMFVLTCSPARDEQAGYVAWGHSTAVGPFAEVLGTTDEKESIVYADLDLGEVETRRMNMPLSRQRRADLYAVVDMTRPGS